MARSPEEILIRWVNYQLRRVCEGKSIKNFNKDIQDGQVYTYLLTAIAPHLTDLRPLRVRHLPSFWLRFRFIVLRTDLGLSLGIEEGAEVLVGIVIRLCVGLFLGIEVGLDIGLRLLLIIGVGLDIMLDILLEKRFRGMAIIKRLRFWNWGIIS